MNFAANFEHDEKVFSYRFFGQKGRGRARFHIEGLHFYAFTPTPLKISLAKRREGQGRLKKMAPTSIKTLPFHEEFEISCPEKQLLKALEESKPLQDLIRGIFAKNVKSIEVREEVMVVEFKNRVPGRQSPKGGHIRTENPVDNAWARDLKLKLLKLSQVITGVTALTKKIKNHDENPGPGLILAAFFAVASAFVATAFYVQQAWYH